MTYRAGIGPGLARAMGITYASSEPTLTCDVVGCGYRIVVRPVRGCMPGWLANKKAPKFWKRWPQPDDKPARHTCPKCTRALSGGGVDMVMHGLEASVSEIDDLRSELAETRKALEDRERALLFEQTSHDRTDKMLNERLESTRAALAKAEARIQSASLLLDKCECPTLSTQIQLWQLETP